MFIADKLNARIHGVSLESILSKDTLSELEFATLDHHVQCANYELVATQQTYTTMSNDVGTLESFMTSIETMKRNNRPVSKDVVALTYAGIDSILSKYNIGREEYAAPTTESNCTEDQLAITLEMDLKQTVTSFFKALWAAIVGIVKAARNLISKVSIFFKSIGSKLKVMLNNIIGLRSEVVLKNPSKEFVAALSLLSRGIDGERSKDNPYEILPIVTTRLTDSLSSMEKFRTYGRNLESVMAAAFGDGSIGTTIEYIAGGDGSNVSDSTIYLATYHTAVFTINGKTLPPVISSTMTHNHSKNAMSPDLEISNFAVHRDELKMLIGGYIRVSKEMETLSRDTESIIKKIEGYSRQVANISPADGNGEFTGRDSYNQLRRSLSAYVEIYQDVTKKTVAMFKAIDIVVGEVLSASKLSIADGSSDITSSDALLSQYLRTTKSPYLGFWRQVTDNERNDLGALAVSGGGKIPDKLFAITGVVEEDKFKSSSKEFQMKSFEVASKGKRIDNGGLCKISYLKNDVNISIFPTDADGKPIRDDINRLSSTLIGIYNFTGKINDLLKTYDIKSLSQQFYNLFNGYDRVGLISDEAIVDLQKCLDQAAGKKVEADITSDDDLLSKYINSTKDTFISIAHQHLDNVKDNCYAVAGTGGSKLPTKPFILAPREGTDRHDPNNPFRKSLDITSKKAFEIVRQGKETKGDNHTSVVVKGKDILLRFTTIGPDGKPVKDVSDRLSTQAFMIYNFKGKIEDILKTYSVRSMFNQFRDTMAYYDELGVIDGTIYANLQACLEKAAGK